MTVGYLAFKHCGLSLPIEVLESAAGFYIGTFDDGPCSRESVEYYSTRAEAEQALRESTWTQRSNP